MRNMKKSTLEEPLIHLSIWIRNDAIMNGEDDEAERRSIPTKQIKISISGISCFWGSEVRQKYAVWVLVGCGIKLCIQRALLVEI